MPSSRPPRGSRREERLALVAFFFLLFGCGGPADDNVIARVDTVEITVEDLLQFNADIPALLRSEEQGVQMWRDHLDSMVDMELMLLEARQAGPRPRFGVSG